MKTIYYTDKAGILRTKKVLSEKWIYAIMIISLMAGIINFG